jgi:hypothetical protein
MPNARSLVKDELEDLATFTRVHPHPALVIDPVGSTQGGLRIDTPDQPYYTGGADETHSTMIPDLDLVGSSTDVLLAVDPHATSVASDELLPDTQIEWLLKSDRNPFGALITVGRAANNDIIVDQATISKVHAIFTKTAGGWFVADSNSSNGTFVDGVRLPASEKRALDDGAEVRLGREIRARLVQPESLHALLKNARRRRRQDPSWR